MLGKGKISDQSGFGGTRKEGYSFKIVVFWKRQLWCSLGKTVRLITTILITQLILKWIVFL